MAALTVPGAPVSVLLDHKLSESIVEKLLAAGIPTVEKLTAVTQEDLDSAGITTDMVSEIQAAVNSYYGAAPVEEVAPEEEPVEATEAIEEAAPVDETSVEHSEAEPESATTENESDTMKNAG